MKLESLKEKASYALGVNIAQSLRQQQVSEIDLDIFSQAVADVYGNNDLAISPEESNALINEYLSKLQAAGAADRIEEGRKFLAKNSLKENVTVLPSGLQYEIIKPGFGPIPKATDTVTTHYHGTLIDGTVFDSSVQRGQPASFPVNGVIMGWQEALQLMPEGSKWRLFVPSDLAYGNRGAGPAIGPGATLIFEVELLGIG